MFLCRSCVKEQFESREEEEYRREVGTIPCISTTNQSLSPSPNVSSPLTRFSFQYIGYKKGDPWRRKRTGVNAEWRRQIKTAKRWVKEETCRMEERRLAEGDKLYRQNARDKMKKPSWRGQAGRGRLEKAGCVNTTTAGRPASQTTQPPEVNEHRLLPPLVLRRYSRRTSECTRTHPITCCVYILRYRLVWRKLWHWITTVCLITTHNKIHLYFCLALHKLTCAPYSLFH